MLFKASEPETPKVPDYLAKELPENAVVGINGQLFSASYIKTMAKSFKNTHIRLYAKVDYGNDIWEDRPAESATEVYNLPVQYSGKSTAEKLKELREKLKELEADALAINTLDGIAWLYNIRANDVACTPVVIAYAYVSQDEAILFTDTSRVGEDVLRVLSENGVTMRSYESVFDYVADIKKPTAVLCDDREMNYGLYHTLQSNENVKLVSGKNPVTMIDPTAFDAVSQHLFQRSRDQEYLRSIPSGWYR